jgi:hypothetical protein
MPLRPHPDVIARRMNPGAVLVHLGHNVIYELNATGVAIWDLIGEGVAIEEIPARLAGQFDVAIEEARREATRLIDLLRTEGLLES